MSSTNYLIELSAQKWFENRKKSREKKEKQLVFAFCGISLLTTFLLYKGYKYWINTKLRKFKKEKEK